MEQTPKYETLGCGGAASSKRARDREKYSRYGGDNVIAPSCFPMRRSGSRQSMRQSQCFRPPVHYSNPHRGRRRADADRQITRPDRLAKVPRRPRHFDPRWKGIRHNLSGCRNRSPIPARRCVTHKRSLKILPACGNRSRLCGIGATLRRRLNRMKHQATAAEI